MTTTQYTPATILEHPLIRCGREACGDLPTALRREWLVTNGIGGYASSTLAGVNTRRYHGLLVASLNPPVDRTVLVGGLIEWVTYAGQHVALAANEYMDGTIDPQGYRSLQSFELRGTLPVWTFAIGDALLERRLWMVHGSNTTCIRYRLLRGTYELGLEITPLVSYRDFHSLTSGQGWRPDVTALPNGARIEAFAGATPFQLYSESAHFEPGGDWFWNFHYREEQARGLDDRGDQYTPGVFKTTLQPDQDLTLVLTTETQPFALLNESLAQEEARQAELLKRASTTTAHPCIQQLTLAADQFIVTRQSQPGAIASGTTEGSESARTVIAGYHWFNDWGRDTMIALPGLTLTTGRAEEAANILLSFSHYVSNGLLPNNFPDQNGVIPGYNTVDATLWYILAIYAYYQATHDDALIKTLLPTLRTIVECHQHGTHYNIGVDAHDGLLHAGEPGLQLTWMDAKVGDWVITPRIGKPVEINALWYNVLRILALLLREQGDETTSTAYDIQAAQVLGAFRSRFLRSGQSYLNDVVDGPDGDDASLRPNQIFAISLPFALLEDAEAKMVIEAVGQSLLTSYGLRSLSPTAAAYTGTYGGDQRQRDAAYHQGTVWTWLMGAYVEAHYRVYRDRQRALELLTPFIDHLQDAGMGSISEILEGYAPHRPRGCIAQAWGVAEVLRVWRLIEAT